MKIRLEYVDGKIKTTDLGGMGYSPFRAEGLPPEFRKIYERIEKDYEKGMKRLTQRFPDQVPIGKLEIELNLELKQK